MQMLNESFDASSIELVYVYRFVFSFIGIVSIHFFVYRYRVNLFFVYRYRIGIQHFCSRRVIFPHIIPQVQH